MSVEDSNHMVHSDEFALLIQFFTGMILGIFYWSEAVDTGQILKISYRMYFFISSVLCRENNSSPKTLGYLYIIQAMINLDVLQKKRSCDVRGWNTRMVRSVWIQITYDYVNTTSTKGTDNLYLHPSAGIKQRIEGENRVYFCTPNNTCTIRFAEQIRWGYKPDLLGMI